jgi:hypothetical protein
LKVTVERAGSRAGSRSGSAPKCHGYGKLVWRVLPNCSVALEFIAFSLWLNPCFLLVHGTSKLYWKGDKLFISSHCSLSLLLTYLYIPVGSKLYFCLAGNWYAMTGYGVAFPRNSKHFANFNRKVMDYSENGKTYHGRSKNDKNFLKMHQKVTITFSLTLR